MRRITDALAPSRWRAFGPSAAAVPATEALRAGLGAVLGLAAAAGLALLLAPDLWLGVYLIAPFGATTVLIFAAPNSPLAQPWPAVVGNTVSALAGLLVSHLGIDPLAGVPAAVGLAIGIMALFRATHPPGGAVAMTVVIGADRILPIGAGFAFLPVMAETLLLVVIAMAYAHATGRRYPFRQFGETNPHGTTDPAPPERLGLTEAELADILVRYNQSLNLGVEDLARLIAAAELQAASHHTPVQTAGDIMSRDLVTVTPDMPLHQVAGLFCRHGFTSLPVVGQDDRYLGVIFQLHLIGAVHDGRSGDPGPVACAGDLMASHVPAAAPDTPIAALLPSLASSRTDAVPVLTGERIAGIVTRTDLVAALARACLRPENV